MFLVLFKTKHCDKIWQAVSRLGCLFHKTVKARAMSACSMHSGLL